MKMVQCLPEFEYFTVFVKNRNFISKIRISKVTDYAALRVFVIVVLTFSTKSFSNNFKSNCSIILIFFRLPTTFVQRYDDTLFQIGWDIAIIEHICIELGKFTT